MAKLILNPVADELNQFIKDTRTLRRAHDVRAVDVAKRIRRSTAWVSLLENGKLHAGRALVLAYREAVEALASRRRRG